MCIRDRGQPARWSRWARRAVAPTRRCAEGAGSAVRAARHAGTARPSVRPAHARRRAQRAGRADPARAARCVQRNLAERPAVRRHAGRRCVAPSIGRGLGAECRLGAVPQAQPMAHVLAARAVRVGRRDGRRPRRVDRAARVPQWRSAARCRCDRAARCRIRGATRSSSATVSAQQMPLACVLEAGTWLAGRQIAAERRAGGGPPVQIESDGTIF